VLSLLLVLLVPVLSLLLVVLLVSVLLP